MTPPDCESPDDTEEQHPWDELARVEPGNAVIWRGRAGAFRVERLSQLDLAVQVVPDEGWYEDTSLVQACAGQSAELPVSVEATEDGPAIVAECDAEPRCLERTVAALERIALVVNWAVHLRDAGRGREPDGSCLRWATRLAESFPESTPSALVTESALEALLARSGGLDAAVGWTERTSECAGALLVRLLLTPDVTLPVGVTDLHEAALPAVATSRTMTGDAPGGAATGTDAACAAFLATSARLAELLDDLPPPDVERAAMVAHLCATGTPCGHLLVAACARSAPRRIAEAITEAVGGQLLRVDAERIATPGLRGWTLEDLDDQLRAAAAGGPAGSTVLLLEGLEVVTGHDAAVHPLLAERRRGSVRMLAELLDRCRATGGMSRLHGRCAPGSRAPEWTAREPVLIVAGLRLADGHAAYRRAPELALPAELRTTWAASIVVDTPDAQRLSRMLRRDALPLVTRMFEAHGLRVEVPEATLGMAARAAVALGHADAGQATAWLVAAATERLCARLREGAADAAPVVLCPDDLAPRLLAAWRAWCDPGCR